MFDSLRYKIVTVRRRGASAWAYSRLGGSIGDRWRLAMLGYAIDPATNPGGNFSRWIRARHPHLSVRPRSLGGSSVTLNTRDWTHMEIFREIFLLHVYDLQRVPFTPDLILDCGGHIGLFTTLAGSHWPATRLIAFEPNPRNSELLARQIADNQLQAELIASAVSTSDRTEWFTVPASPGGRLGAPATEPGDRFEVSVIDLPHRLGELAPQRLLLKMDIEGEEATLLPALIPLLPQQTALFFETHDGPITWDRLDALLRAAGFSVTLLRARDPYRDGFAVRT